ncbi:MAG: GTPase ObgE [Pseudomonadota bacterium]
MIFVDTAKVTIKSGNGGNGCMSFRREKYVPRGGPDGGDGADGGDVIFVGDRGMDSLIKFRYSPRLFAEPGHHGMGSKCSGKKGRDLIVRVPCGTILRNPDTEETICEIIEPEVPVAIARGGRGGRGNQHFATSTNQAPRHCEEGRPGMEFKAVLELKVMADVGLVGLPNAGKSSLITAVSKAHPKVADYPFTTLNPVVGVIELSDYRTMVMADIPGIIEGASQGKGLGLKFLKHVERTKVLLFVLDVSQFADMPPEQAFSTLCGEIHTFGKGLENKKFLIAANKIDLDADRTAFNKLISTLDADCAAKVFPLSAITREGTDMLVAALYTMLHEEERD